MKYRVKVSEKEYMVEVGDLNQNPVIAIVDGKEIPVYLEPQVTQQENNSQNQKGSWSDKVRVKLDPSSNASGKLVMAPLPGVIISIKVSQHDNVNNGDELCVIEAMKMNNVIKASRTGKISRILVHKGQVVRHRELLFEYE